MVSLIAYLIGELLTPLAGRTFFRAVKRFPPAFAVVALAGEGVGVWAVGFSADDDWTLKSIGAGCLAFYTGLLVLLAVKLRAGTWGDFCDSSASQFE